MPETFQHRRARACLQVLLISGGICSRSGFSMKCLSPKKEVASRSHREGLDWGALLETPGVEPALFYSWGNQREKRGLAQGHTVTYGPARTANTTQRHSSQAVMGPYTDPSAHSRTGSLRLHCPPPGHVGQAAVNSPSSGPPSYHGVFMVSSCFFFFFFW